MTQKRGAAPEDHSLWLLARRRAEQTPETEAVSGDGVRRSFASVYEDAEALAFSLHALGLRRGDVLSFQLPNWTETACLNLAASLLGLVCNPIVPIYRDAELSAILADAHTKCFFVPQLWRGYDYTAMAVRLQRDLPDLRHLIAVRAKVDTLLSFEDIIAGGRGKKFGPGLSGADDRKLLLFTSGTTGRAKGVVHSQRSLTAPVVRAVEKWGIGSGDCFLMPSPVTHSTGYCCGLELPFTMGTRTVLMESWNAAKAVALIGSEDVAAMIGATPFLDELVAVAQQQNAGLKSLKVFACGGASVPPALIARANTIFSARTFRVYGASEAPLVTYGARAQNDGVVAATTDGRINGYDVRIVDAGEHDVAPGQEGEILVKGPGLFLGYSEAEFNRDAFAPDGFFRTGDLGRLVDGDALEITGRKKDLIIRGGENISAKEIEDALAGDARWRETAAVAMPHPRLGETVCLFAVAADGAKVVLADMVGVLKKAGFAAQKFPERLVLMDALPKTPSGKIRKDLLRDLARQS